MQNISSLFKAKSILKQKANIKKEDSNTSNNSVSTSAPSSTQSTPRETPGSRISSRVSISLKEASAAIQKGVKTQFEILFNSIEYTKETQQLLSSCPAKLPQYITVSWRRGLKKTNTGRTNCATLGNQQQDESILDTHLQYSWLEPTTKTENTNRVKLKCTMIPVLSTNNLSSSPGKNKVFLSKMIKLSVNESDEKGKKIRKLCRMQYDLMDPFVNMTSSNTTSTNVTIPAEFTVKQLSNKSGAKSTPLSKLKELMEQTNTITVKINVNLTVSCKIIGEEESVDNTSTIASNEDVTDDLLTEDEETDKSQLTNSEMAELTIPFSQSPTNADSRPRRTSDPAFEPATKLTRSTSTPQDLSKAAMIAVEPLKDSQTSSSPPRHSIKPGEVRVVPLSETVKAASLSNLDALIKQTFTRNRSRSASPIADRMSLQVEPGDSPRYRGIKPIELISSETQTDAFSENEREQLEQQVKKSQDENNMLHTKLDKMTKVMHMKENDNIELINKLNTKIQQLQDALSQTIEERNGLEVARQQVNSELVQYTAHANSLSLSINEQRTQIQQLNELLDSSTSQAQASKHLQKMLVKKLHKSKNANYKIKTEALKLRDKFVQLRAEKQQQAKKLSELESPTFHIISIAIIWGLIAAFCTVIALPYTFTVYNTFPSSPRSFSNNTITTNSTTSTLPMSHHYIRIDNLIARKAFGAFLLYSFLVYFGLSLSKGLKIETNILKYLLNLQVYMNSSTIQSQELRERIKQNSWWGVCIGLSLAVYYGVSKGLLGLFITLPQVPYHNTSLLQRLFYSIGEGLTKELFGRAFLFIYIWKLLHMLATYEPKANTPLTQLLQSLKAFVVVNHGKETAVQPDSVVRPAIAISSVLCALVQLFCSPELALAKTALSWIVSLVRVAVAQCAIGASFAALLASTHQIEAVLVARIACELVTNMLS